MVMSLYEKVPTAMGEIPAPPGVSLPAGFPGLELFGQLIDQLGLTKLGVYTPWAARESGVEWEEIDQPPDTNIAAFVINDALLRTALGITFGNPLPFIAIVTDGLPTPTQVSQALALSPYSFYQTQACYRQDDTGHVPKIYYVHWAEYRKPGDPMHGKGSIDKAAQMVNGTSVYAAQLDYRSTAFRASPPVPFSQALAEQAGGALGPPPLPPELAPPGSQPPGPTPSISPARAYVVPGLIALGLGAVTFAIVRQMRK
jgi:hypothetical protein